MSWTFCLDRSTKAKKKVFKMAFSHAHRNLWFASMIFVILPGFNLGLLSDYKICGDSECESLMSRVQAVRDHRGQDCRFLSFRQGDTIFVYHKLTGKREDLWAGTIDRKFGYFPKDAVQEEQVYAATEKVVETQKSDFICMDEYGYPIDSSHLDNSDEDGDHNQPPEIIQPIAHPDDTKAKHPSTSIDSLSESPDQPDATSREEDKNQNSGITASTTREDTRETPAALGEQGGSPSASWLGSSVTGWLGLGKEEQNKREEPQQEASLTSSVTGWLGFGGEKKLDDTVNNREEDKEVDASFTSTMTGWLGLGGEKKRDATKHQHEEKDINDESEPKETFRSRRMSLDLEGSQLQEEEKEVGTLDWLGNGLSSTLGFGVKNQETDPNKEEKEKPTSSSWLDIGVGDILGFGKPKNEVDESTRSDFKQKDTTLEEATPSDQAEINQSQPVQEEQRKTDPDEQRLEEKEVGMETLQEMGDNINSSSSKDTNNLNGEEHVEDYFSHSEVMSATLTLEEGFDNNTAASDGSEGNSLPVDQKDVSTQTTSEESPQALGGRTFMIDEGSPEATGEGHQIYKYTNNRDLEEEKIKSASDYRDLLTQLNTDLESDRYSMDSKGQYEANTDGGQQESKTTEHLEDESARITNQVENREESTMVVLELSGKNDAHEEENSAERDVPTLTESAEPIREEGSISEDSNIEKESHNVVGIQNGEARSLNVYENPSEDQILARDTIIQHKDPESGSLENEEVIVLKETAKQEESGGVKDGERQQIMEERKQEEDNIKKAEMEEEKENQEVIKMVKEEEKHGEMEEVKEEVHQDRKEELKKEEIQERVDIVQEEMRQEEIEKEGENEEQEVKELKEEEKGENEEMVGLEGAKEREKWDGWGEAEKREKTQQVEEVASMEKQKDNEGEESVEEEKGEVLNDVKEEENQVKTVKFQVEEREAEVEEVGKRKEEKEQVEEQQQIVAGSNEKEREKKRQEEIQKSKEEEKQEKLNKLNDLKEKEKEKDEEITVQEAQKETIHDIGKLELESSEETHDENTKTEENKREEMKHDNVEESKEEETAGDEMQQVTDVEDERRNNEEEESHQCSNKPQHQDTEGELAGVRNENISDLKPSSADDSMIKQRKHNEQILESETISSEGMETDRLSEEEPEKDSDDSEVVEGENTDITSNATGSESIYSKNVNVSDHNGLKVEQMGAASHTDNDQHVTGESGHSGRPDGMSLDETSERKEHGHRAQNDKLSQGHVSHGPVGSGTNNRVQIESEGGGAFGLFKNAFSFFSQTPVTKTKEPTASTPGLDTDTSETSPPQAFLTLEQKSDSTTNANQVPVKEIDKDSPISMSTQQHRQPPPASALSPSPEAAAQTKSLAKYYKNLLSHVSVEELTYLVDLFGQNKLQFLDYTLGSSENHTDDPDHDESILSDIERLLHHHRETVAMSQEANEKTKTLVALQKLEMLLDKLREAFSTRKSDVSKANRQADASCVGASCSTNGKDQKEPQTTQDFSVAKDAKAQRDKRKPEEIDNGQPGAVTEEPRETEVWTGRQKKTQSHPRIQGGSPQPQEGVMKQSLDFVRRIVTDSVTYGRATREALVWITVQVVSSLPDDLRPGPDLYGLPWEPVIISSVVGLVTVLLFTCRCYRSVKSRMYRSKERWMAEQVAQLLDEKCKVLETLSKCQQEYDELEDSLRDSGVLAQTQKTEQLEIKGRQVEHAKEELERDIGQLKDQLERQREHRLEQERKIAVLEESMKTLEDETKDLQSQEEQAQTTLKVYSMNSNRLQRNLETAGEESTLLQDSNAQLRQQAEGWAERVSELEAEIRRCEVAYSGMQQHVSNKDERIMSLTDHLLRMKAWDSDLEESEEEEKKEASNGTAAKLEGEREDITDTQGHLQKVQKLIYAAKLNADLKSLDEDKDRVFAKLNDEVKAKEDLQESIKELENEKLLLQSDAEQYSDQVQRLQQKLHIMTEMYQDNELKLHRLLTVEERERLQKEEKLNKADKNIALAIEEVNNYRQRAEEMEEELEKTRQSYQTQISSHEKKAHNNWLAARAAERDLADIRRENALLRQKLTDTQFKLDAIDKDPYALDSLARPLPFRAERSPYGPSPLGRPASETRPFLSPPTLLDAPPARLSPRMSHGPVERPASQGEMERSGGPHSDSGSISPTWERDRRGPPLGPHGSHGPIGPPGYMFPELGGPMYRRPLPPPGAIGILPPPGSLPPGPLLPHPRGFLTGPPSGPPHSTDIADGPYSENTRPIDQQHRESGSGDRRTPPEADLRMGGPLPPGPPMGPMDGPFPRRSPYGPPPPDFYPPRGPGGPAMRPMWAPPPSGMMFPPRFPPSGPPLSNAPHPHFPPTMRPVAPDRLPPSSMGPAPPQQSLPFPPHSQSSEEHATSPEDAI